VLVVAIAAVSAIAVGIGAWWIVRRLRGLEVALRREVTPGDLVRGAEQANYRGAPARSPG
jgi:hypothetical protein